MMDSASEVSMATKKLGSSSQTDFVSPTVISEVANQLKRIGDELTKSHDPSWLNRHMTGVTSQVLITQVFLLMLK